jgi:lysozyme family protein
MASFDPIFHALMAAEGGYVNDPADPGGETKYGITIARWKAWQAKGRYPEMKLKDITVPIAKEFYASEEWSWIMGSQIASQAVAHVLFDWTVNAGNVAAKAAQKILGLPADGIIGPKSLAAINAAGDRLANKLTSARIAFYQELAARKPNLQKFLKGWLIRANKLIIKDTAMNGIVVVAIASVGVYAFWKYAHA